MINKISYRTTPANSFNNANKISFSHKIKPDACDDILEAMLSGFGKSPEPGASVSPADIVDGIKRNVLPILKRSGYAELAENLVEAIKKFEA